MEVKNRMHILVQNNQRRHQAPLRPIRQAAATILSALGCPDETELSITITGDRAIHRLNRDYLGKDRPTNVISFSLQEGEFSELACHALGDVVISADTAAQEAAGAGWSPYERLIFLLLHGILHLCGYDHERSGATAARRMERKQQELWQLLQQKGLTTLPPISP